MIAGVEQRRVYESLEHLELGRDGFAQRWVKCVLAAQGGAPRSGCRPVDGGGRPWNWRARRDTSPVRILGRAWRRRAIGRGSGRPQGSAVCLAPTGGRACWRHPGNSRAETGILFIKVRLGAIGLVGLRRGHASLAETATARTPEGLVPILRRVHVGFRDRRV